MRRIISARVAASRRRRWSVTPAANDAASRLAPRSRRVQAYTLANVLARLRNRRQCILSRAAERACRFDARVGTHGTCPNIWGPRAARGADLCWCLVECELHARGLKVLVVDCLIGRVDRDETRVRHLALAAVAYEVGIQDNLQKLELEFVSVIALGLRLVLRACSTE